MGLDGIAGFDQFVACRNHADGGLGTDADTRHTGSGCDRDFGCAESDPRVQQGGSLQTIGTSRMHISARSHVELARQSGSSVTETNLLDGDDGIAALRQDGTGHDFDRMLRTRESERWIASGLHALNHELTLSRYDSGTVDRDPVHGYPIERWVVSLGVDVLAQHGADTLHERQ